MGDSPRDIAETADITISMIADTDALERIARGPDGSCPDCPRARFLLI
jgi:3-hydroxyisobutyrate dehydrogenase-like beta-hydroxyacid dehydrogenase